MKDYFVPAECEIVSGHVKHGWSVTGWKFNERSAKGKSEKERNETNVEGYLQDIIAALVPLSVQAT